MIDFIPLLQTYGYLGVFIGSIFEGEAFLFVGGILAHKDIINLNLTIICIAAALGAFLGDNVWFWIGRHRRVWVQRRMPKAYARAESMLQSLESRPRIFSAGMRFMYGFRSLMPLSLGLSHVRARTFVFWNSVGSIIWSSTITIAGYYVGDFLIGVFGKMHVREARVLIASAIVIGVAFVLYHLIERGARKVVHAPESN